MIPTSANPLDEEAQAAIAAAMQGGIDPFGGGDMTIPEAAPAPQQQQPLPPGPTAPAGPMEMPAVPSAPPSQGAPRHRSAQGHVDPELAFMAAFAQNPVLMRMVEESRNRPQRQQEFDAKQAAEGRASEKWQQERDLYAPEKLKKLQLGNQGAATSLEGGDPKSAYSKAMREALSRSLGMQAQRMAQAGSPLAAQMQQAAQSMANEGISADRAEAIAKTFGRFGDNAVGDARSAASQAETNRSHLASEEIARGRLALARNKANARGAGGGKAGAKQEKLNAEINKLDESLAQMQEIGRLKGNVNTGVYVSAYNDFLEKWISSGLTSEERKNMNALVSRTFNERTHELAGSAVSDAEWARIAPEIPQMGDDDELFVSKLNNALRITSEILSKRREEYQQAGGKPTDRSVTARKNVHAANAAGEKPLPDATPRRSVNDAQDGARAFSKSAGKYFVRKGGKWVPE